MLRDFLHNKSRQIKFCYWLVIFGLVIVKGFLKSEIHFTFTQHRNMKRILTAAVVLFLVSACTKTEDVIVKDNIPPPDHTIDSTVIEIYANKVFVNLLGREPIGNERTSALSILKQENFSVARREQFIETLITKSEYRANLYTTANHEYLNDLDSTTMAEQIQLFEYFLTQPQYAPFYSIIQSELTRMYVLRNTKADLVSGAIDFRTTLKNCTGNYFYDQINMGTENFVVSTYQNFLFRYPTDAELVNGKIMVDGSEAILFLQTGESKADYINIFFNSDDYYEGRVRYVFVKYLFREPTPAEIGWYAGVYKNSGSYGALQKAVLAGDEYAGVD